jgi:hypothetical protein
MGSRFPEGDELMRGKGLTAEARQAACFSSR